MDKSKHYIFDFKYKLTTKFVCLFSKDKTDSLTREKHYTQGNEDEDEDEDEVEDKDEETVSGSTVFSLELIQANSKTSSPN